MAAVNETPAQTAPRRWILVTTIGVFVALFAFALAEYARVRWYPVLDDALTELRVRSVTSGHPPLIGLPGRIGTPVHPGSHLGPISFYLLWPVYRLFGASAWSLQLATAFLHVVAIALTLWIAFRRRGVALMLGFAVVLVALVAFFGPLVLTDPWNPYLPVLWWVAFLVAIWAATCGDVVGPPVAAVAGAMCLQTHISYAGLVPGLAAVAAVVVVVRLARRRLRWSRAATWSVAVAVGVTVLAWIPPIVQQLGNDPGNLRIAFDYFSDPPSRVLGASDGVSVLLVHLNPWNVLALHNVVTGSIVPGLVVLGAWVASFAIAVVRRVTDLVLLDVLVAAALVLGAASTARIFGPVSYYLVLWAWGLLGVVLVATAWGLVELVSTWARAGRMIAIALVVLGIVLAGWRGGSFVDVAGRHPLPSSVEQPLLDRLVPATERGLARVARSHRYRYTMTWHDGLRLGGIGYALFNELRRQGTPVTAYFGYGQFLPAYLLTKRYEADAALHLAVGDDIGRWRKEPGAVEVAHADGRTPVLRALFRSRRADAIATLRRIGRADLVAGFLDNTRAVPGDLRYPASVRADADVMIAVGDRAAVFVQPVTGP
jgi:hypothetical protein